MASTKICNQHYNSFTITACLWASPYRCSSQVMRPTPLGDFAKVTSRNAFLRPNVPSSPNSGWIPEPNGFQSLHTGLAYASRELPPKLLPPLSIARVRFELTFTRLERPVSLTVRPTGQVILPCVCSILEHYSTQDKHTL